MPSLPTMPEMPATAAHHDPPSLTEAEIEEWTHHFHDNVEPLSTIKPPALCTTHPESAPAILAAYLHETTFTVKLPVNYVSEWQRFFVDNRIDSCARLYLTKYQQESIRHHRFFKVRFLVGTLWKTLCEVDVKVVTQDPALFDEETDGKCYLEAMMRITEAGREHEIFAKFVESNVDLFNNGVEVSKKGLKMWELEAMASLFLAKPGADFKYLGVDAWRGQYLYAANWRDYERDWDAVEDMSAQFWYD